MLNKAIMMGRLTKDPDFRQTQSGIPCCRFSIAINRPKNKNGEQETDYLDCVAWRGTAEFISRYFSKGNMILIDGQMRNNNYTDSNGQKQYRMELLCDNVSFCESKGNGSSDGAAAEQYPQQGYQEQPPAYQQQYQAPPQQYQQGYQQQYQAPPPQFGSLPPQSGNPFYPQQQR